MIERQKRRLVSLASHWIRVHGRQMHFRASPPATGERLSVVLVHGLTVSGRYLLPAAAALLDNYPVFVPDLPGFGESEKPPHVLNIREMADTVADWMDAIELEQAYFLGNSLGCHTLAALGVYHPERMARAVFVSPPGDPAGRHALRLIGRGLYDFPREPWSLIPIYMRDFRQAGLRATLLTLHYLLQSRFESWLPQVEKPVLVVGGAKDRIVPASWIRRVGTLLPCAQTTFIPEAGHVSNFTHPQRLAALAGAFFGPRYP